MYRAEAEMVAAIDAALVAARPRYAPGDLRTMSGLAGLESLMSRRCLREPTDEDRLLAERIEGQAPEVWELARAVWWSLQWHGEANASAFLERYRQRVA